MTVKVDLSIGEDYPHLFVSADPDDIASTERMAGSEYGGTVVELSDEEWADFRDAQDRYYGWVQKLAANKPPAGNPETNPSRAYEQRQAVILDELGADLGCKPH